LANATQEEAPKVKPVSLNGVSEKQKVTEWLQMANEEVTGKARPPTAPPQGTSPKRTVIDYVHDVTQDGDVEANPGMAAMARPSAWVVLVQRGRTTSVATKVYHLLDGVPWDVDTVKKAVKVKFANSLVGVSAPRLTVKLENSREAEALREDADVPDTTVENPLYIFAPRGGGALGTLEEIFRVVFLGEPLSQHGRQASAPPLPSPCSPSHQRGSSEPQSQPSLWQRFRSSFSSATLSGSSSHASQRQSSVSCSRSFSTAPNNPELQRLLGDDFCTELSSDSSAKTQSQSSIHVDGGSTVAATSRAFDTYSAPILRQRLPTSDHHE